MWLLFCLFFHVSTGWARMPKPCFIAQIYCFLRCCTKSFGYKYLLKYINIYNLLTHKYIPDTHIHIICTLMVSQGGLSGIFLRKDRDSCFASATRFLASQALRDNEPLRVLIPPFFARRSESLRFRAFFAERQGFLLRFTPQALRDNEPLRVLIPSFYARRPESLRFRAFFAERQGFEPWVPARAQRFSRPPRSTTPASFRISHAVARVVLWVQRY